MTWSLTTPLDTDPIRAGDDKIRELKSDLEDALSEEHSFPIDGSDPKCYHNIPSGTTAARPAAGVAGRWYYNTTTGTIQRDNGASWDDLTDGVVIESGTVMFFCQSTVPTGWIRSTSFNDQMLRVVTGSTGGDTGGDWGVTYAAQDNAHTHGSSDSYSFPNSHSGPSFDGGESGGAQSDWLIQIAGFTHSGVGDHIHATGSDDFNHGHTIASSWKPAYKDIICATKN